MASNDNASDSKPFLGKNIFFVHANDIIHNQLVMPTLHAEYQVYEIDSDEDIMTAVSRYPDAVMIFYLANAKSDFSFSPHAKMIEKLYGISSRHNLRIGIISDTSSTSLRRAALYNAGINGVFLPLSDSYDLVMRNILKSFDLIGAKGVRRYVRAVCDEEDNATVSWSMDDKTLVGSLVDVSSVGVNVRFVDDPNLAVDRQSFDMVMSIRGIDVRRTARVFGVRQIGSTNSKEYIMLFDSDGSLTERSKIYDYIYYCLRRDFKR